MVAARANTDTRAISVASDILKFFFIIFTQYLYIGISIKSKKQILPVEAIAASPFSYDVNRVLRIVFYLFAQLSYMDHYSVV